MKLKLLLPFLLFCGIASAQIANIPDGPFKTLLLNAPNTNYITITKFSTTDEILDVNNDGLIQVSEALDVKQINLRDSDLSGVTTVPGIQAFANMQRLTVQNAAMTSLDASGMTSLQYVRLGVVSGTANFTGCTGVTTLDVTDDGVFAEGYNVGTLNCTGMTSLVDFPSSSATIKNINFTGCTELQDLDLHFRSVQTLNLTGCTGLKNLSSLSNDFASLNLTSCTGLETFEISGFETNTITFGSHLFLTEVHIDLLGLNPLNFSGCPNIATLDISADMTSLDLSMLPAIQDLKLLIGNGLTSLNIKNGDISYTNFQVSTHGPTFICVDEGEESLFTGQSFNADAVINSYCSFTPGGNYNTITGVVRFDQEGNGCGTGTDGTYENMKVKVTHGSSSGYTYTNAVGQYIFYAIAGDYNVSPQFENSFFSPAPVSQLISFANTNNNTTNQDFCITANGVHPDLEVVIMPVGIANPGFNATYKIIYKNKGNQALSGAVSFNYNDSVFDFVSANPVQASTATGVLNWNYANLQPFETGEIVVALNLNSPMETPAVNVGDILNFSAAITPVTGDETPEDNNFGLNQVAAGSFDPNDITCLEGATAPLTAIGDYLHYLVRFENSGTAATSFIVVKHNINPADYDVNTLELLDASHPVITRITGNKVEFIFDNLALQPNGHGNILFKLKSKYNLVAGDNVVNNANIYFDYNWPVQTNDANTVFQILSRGDFDKDDSVQVYPNPAKNTINIKADTNVQSVQLYDAQGRLLESASGIVEIMDISARAAGIYFLKVKTEKGIKTEKIVKQ